MERCFACGRKLGANPERVDTRDAQTVYVGRECFKEISKAGTTGWQPPKGGPRLYLLPKDVESDGMTPTKEVFGRIACKCLRCTPPYVWLAEGKKPERCPNCKSMLWDTSRKQQRGPKPGSPRKRGPKTWKPNPRGIEGIGFEAIMKRKAKSKPKRAKGRK